MNSEACADDRLPQGKGGDEALDDKARSFGCGTGWLACALCSCVLIVIGFSWFKHSSGPDVGQAVDLLVKPKGDLRTYRFATLPNGLKVVSVHDPKALTAAYSVSVKAGSYDDPQILPGLAHFVEHMVFLGSKRYPTPDGYDNYIKGHAGSLNAYTANEVTVFYTELLQEAVEEGMDRFSDFLRAPLFDATYMDKEVHAVDSEHAKNVQDPERRVFAVLEDLAAPESPVSQFHTGDLQTLKHEAKTSDIRAELRKWFREHYCPSRMSLATYGSEPLSEQIKRASRLFGDLPAGSGTCQGPRRSWASPAAWPESRRGKWVTMLGTQPQPQLVQAFLLPDVTKEFKSHPLSYITYVLNYGGERSLLTFLRDDLGLISTMSVSASTDSAGAMLAVSYDLSRDGLKQPGLVLDAFFYYVATLRKVPVNHELYASIANVSRLGWDWTQPAGPSETASALAEALTRLPPERLLTGDSLIEEQDVGMVANLINLLVPENMNAVLVEQSARLSQPVHNVSHYGVTYSVNDLRSQLPSNYARWSAWLRDEPSELPAASQELLAALAGAAPGAVAAVTLPQPPRPIEVPADINTQLMHASVHADIWGSWPVVLDAKQTQSEPDHELLVEARGLAVASAAVGSGLMALATVAKNTSSEASDKGGKWYRQGWVTNSPVVKATVLLQPRRPKEQWERPASEEVRLELYERLLSEVIAPKLYDRMTGGANFVLDFSSAGLTLSVEGFPTLVPHLVEGVLKELQTGVPTTSNAVRFARVLADYKDSLLSHSAMPVQYAVQDRNILLTLNDFSQEECLTALSSLEASSVASAAQEILLAAPLKLTGLVMGNVAQDDGEAMLSQIQEGLGRGALAAAEGDTLEAPSVVPVVRPAAPVELRKLNPRPGDPNDVAVVTLLVGVATVESRVLYGILGQILEPLAYTELRTRQQLGYVVSAGMDKLSNVLFVSTVVQGNVLRADEAEAAVEQVYFELMPERLSNMTKDEFQNYRRAFISMLMQPPTTTQDEFAHFWGSVSKGGQCLNLRSEMLRFLEESVLDKGVLMQAWQALLNPAEGQRQKVAVKYFAGQVPERPSLQDAQRTWQARGLSAGAVQHLEQEYRVAQILNRADSEARRSLAQTGGYFPQALECELREDFTKPSAITSVGRPGRQPGPLAFLGVRGD